MMHILCYISSMRRAGAQRVLSILMNAWARNGHEVTLVTHRQEPAGYALDDRIVVRSLGETTGGGVGAILRHSRRLPGLRRLVRAASPDVIVSFGDTCNVRMLLAAGSCPVIISERIDPASGHRIPFWWRWWRRGLYRKAQALVVQHEGQAAYFSRLVHHMEVIPNPVDVDRLPAVRTDARRRTVLAAGRLHRQKGFDLLIRAFARMAGHYPDWSLEIVGEGAERAALEGLVAEEGLESSVSLPGVVEDVPRACARCGCFVLSSRFEGMPNVLLEAMASATPVLATRCSASITQLLENEKNSILVAADSVDALADGLERLVGDDHLREQLGPAAREAVLPLSVPNILSRWNALLECVTTGEEE